MTDPPALRYITLDQFLKHRNLVGSGGEAKVHIQAGMVMVNDEVDTRRRRKLYLGDVVEFDGERFEVEASEADSLRSRE